MNIPLAIGLALASLCSPSLGRDVNVLFVDDSTGEPLAGAEVRAYGDPESSFWVSAMDRSDMSQRFFWPGTKRLTANERGLLALESKDKSYLVLAQATVGGARLTGKLEVEPGPPRELTLRLQPAVDLLVYAELRSGEPVVGVPLQLTTEDGVRSFSSADWVTDANGEFVFYNANLFMPIGLGHERATVRSAALGASPEATFELEPFAGEPVGLLCPSSDQVIDVEVRLVDFHGATLTGESRHVELREIGARRHASVNATTLTDTCTFKSVPRGTGLSLAAFGAMGKRPRLVFETPSFAENPAPSMMVELVLGAPAWVVTGQLVDATGQPLADQAFEAWLGSSALEPQRTDADGRFELQLDDQHGWPLGQRGQLSVQLAGESKSWLGHSADFSRESETVQHDTGAIVVAEVPLVVSGLVVDSMGAPIPGALVTIKAPLVDPATGELVERPNGGLVFAPVPGGSWFSDDAGHFEVRAVLHGETLSLRAERAGFLPLEAWVSATRGASDVRIVLGGTGSLAGSIRATMGAPERDWTVFLVPTGTRRTWTPRGSGPFYRSGQEDPDRRAVDRRGAFEFLELAPGLYDLGLLGNADTQPRVLIEGLEVTAGRRCEDSRLRAIDPKDTRSSIRLTTAREKAFALQRGLTHAFTQSTPGGRFDREVELYNHRPHPSVELCLDALPAELLVLVGGHRDQLMHLDDPARKEYAIELKDGIPLRFQLPADLVLSPLTRLSLRLSGGPHSEALEQSFWFQNVEANAHGLFETTAGSPGSFTARLELLVSDNDFSSWTTRPIEFELALLVEDKTTPQTFALPVSQSAIDAAAR